MSIDVLALVRLTPERVAALSADMASSIAELSVP